MKRKLDGNYHIWEDIIIDHNGVGCGDMGWILLAQDAVE
jgi:hypothetical protein